MAIGQQRGVVPSNGKVLQIDHVLGDRSASGLRAGPGQLEGGGGDV